MTGLLWTLRGPGRRTWGCYEMRELARADIGYVIQKKNKRKCRDWRVYAFDPAVWGERHCIAELDDLTEQEAINAAAVLLSAYRSTT